MRVLGDTPFRRQVVVDKADWNDAVVGAKWLTERVDADLRSADQAGILLCDDVMVKPIPGTTSLMILFNPSAVMHA